MPEQEKGQPPWATIRRLDAAIERLYDERNTLITLGETLAEAHRASAPDCPALRAWDNHMIENYREALGGFS